jgi:DNA polymerase III subunit beta
MLTISRDELLQPLQTVIGVVEKKQTMQILANAYIQITENKLQIVGSDLEVELIGKMNLNEAVSKSVELTLPGRTLLDICRSFSGDSMIDLFQDGDQIIVRSGNSRFALNTLPAADFPKVVDDKSNITFNISQGDLLQLLKLTQFAMAQQDVRYYLNGVMLEFNGNTLRAVATDGHRINVNTATIDAQVDHRMQIIVPRKGVIELIRLLESTDENIEVSVGNNHIRCETDKLVFTCKLIEGRFPDYMPIFSTKCDKSIELPVERLLASLQRSAIVSQDRDHNVRLEIRDNVMRVFSSNNTETAEEELIIDYQSDDIDICFNIFYLLDIFNTCSSQQIRMSFTSSTGFVLFEPTESDEHLFVVMPIRL